MSPLVAVLDPFSLTQAAHLLRAGAANVVARSAPAAEFRRVVDEARSGRVTVSLELLRATAAAPVRPAPPNDVSDEELSWLRGLSAGVGVESLAEQAHLSQRVMYRRLREL